MAKYLVLKRIKEDRVALPGELLDASELPASVASVLIARGYIIPVPEDYPGAVGESLYAPETVPTVSVVIEAPPPVVDSPYFAPSITVASGEVTELMISEPKEPEIIEPSEPKKPVVKKPVVKATPKPTTRPRPVARSMKVTRRSS